MLINALSGFGSGRTKASVVFNRSAVDTSDRYNDVSFHGTYTFSSIPFGAKDANRIIVVGVAMFDGRDTLVVTIGGITAISIVADDTGTVDYKLYRTRVPTGTSGSIVVRVHHPGFAGDLNSSGCLIGCWSVYGADFSPYHTATSDARPTATVTLNIPPDGIAIAVCTAYSDTTGLNFVWTGVQENFEIAGDRNDYFSGACAAVPEGAVNRTISSSASLNATVHLGVASFGPA
ncbi:MAG: hypothetical protein FD149_2452 [Rhodospirillaceae bacterium]|nr:MAG: hypothetical protein FD149_2452 [Rhodospirillaceae bacterium]